MEIKFTENDKRHAEMMRNGENGLGVFLISPNQEKCSLELKINDHLYRKFKGSYKTESQAPSSLSS